MVHQAHCASALREAPPAAPRHWCRFHTANFTYIVLSSSSFVDQLLSANAIGASVRRGEFKELPYSGHAIEKEGKAAKKERFFCAEPISPLQLQNDAQNVNFGLQSHLNMKLNPCRMFFRSMVTPIRDRSWLKIWPPCMKMVVHGKCGVFRFF